MKNLALVAAMTVVLAPAPRAQVPLPPVRAATDTVRARADQTRADSSGLPADSSLVYPPPPFWGSVDMRLPAAWILSRSDISLQPGRSLVDAFRSLPGFTLLSPEVEGQYAELFARGVDARSVGFLANGRTTQDPVSGIMNPYAIQWMDLDHLEIITGPRSILYGLNCQGAAVNLVAKDFNANRPYSRIAYAEGPANFSYSDGTLVQNISRRLNVNLGFQHLSSDGVYPNSLHDQWNIRGRVRYNLSVNFALMFSGQYLSTQTGLNGGIDPVSSGSILAFRPLQAVMVNTDAYEKLTRGDLDATLAGRWLDSTMTLRVSLYTTHLLREYRDEENRRLPNGIDVRSDQEVRWSGLTARHEWASGGLSFLAGALAEKTDVQASPNLGRRNESHTAVWAKADVDILSALRAAVFGRMERLYGMAAAGVGGDCAWSGAEGIALFAGISLSGRIPNLFERFWADSGVARFQPGGLESERHTHLEAGIEAHPSSAVSMRTTFFHRIIKNPIDLLEGPASAGFPGIEISQGSGSRTITGLDASLSVQLWHLLLEGSGTYLASVSGGEAPPERLPKISARGGLYLRGNFFDGDLDLKTGVRGTLSSMYAGDRFNGETLMWGASPGTSIGAWSRLDFVLTARLGDARIDFLWENLTNVQAFPARYYAIPDRGIWFRIGWEFVN